MLHVCGMQSDGMEVHLIERFHVIIHFLYKTAMKQCRTNCNYIH